MKERFRIEAIKAGGDAVNGKGIATKVGQIEAQVGKLGHHLIDGYSLGWRELHRFGEQQFLGGDEMTILLTLVAVVEYTDAGTMLVDNHQARLDGRHEILALVLIVGGRLLRENLGGRLRLNDIIVVEQRRLLQRHLDSGTSLLNTFVERLPLIGRRSLRCSTTIISSSLSRPPRFSPRSHLPTINIRESI